MTLERALIGVQENHEWRPNKQLGFVLFGWFFLGICGNMGWTSLLNHHPRGMHVFTRFQPFLRKFKINKPGWSVQLCFATWMTIMTIAQNIARLLNWLETSKSSKCFLTLVRLSFSYILFAERDVLLEGFNWQSFSFGYGRLMST